MNSKFIFWILLPILLLSSCYKSTEWEDVTADYDPVLNVMAIISLDGNIDSFVGVYRTTELTETSMIFTGIVIVLGLGLFFLEILCVINAAVRAGEGKIYHYPLSINFIQLTSEEQQDLQEENFQTSL